MGERQNTTQIMVLAKLQLLEYTDQDGMVQEGHRDHYLVFDKNTIGVYGTGFYWKGSVHKFKLVRRETNVYDFYLLKSCGRRCHRKKIPILILEKENGLIVGCDIITPGTKFYATFGSSVIYGPAAHLQFRDYGVS